MLSLNKKNIGITILILLIFIVSYIQWGNLQQKSKNEIYNKECLKNLKVEQGTYWINLRGYDLKEQINLKINILRNGKVINSYSKSIDPYFSTSFENNDLMKSDTIEVRIKNDTYYIHSFLTEMQFYNKHNSCELKSYYVNETKKYISGQYAKFELTKSLKRNSNH